ncbi:hypothetical protein XELAEV_18010194mg [Xenopus laevis]|uniref:Uncharacterized protein n=1 Tax=Xenopus laevis TaxID=8355 RepID=A0A974I140_XENLA|nr:hypothetical protein XELAEV_18010194mg [Xenopus laevis]
MEMTSLSVQTPSINPVSTQGSYCNNLIIWSTRFGKNWKKESRNSSANRIWLSLNVTLYGQMHKCPRGTSGKMPMGNRCAFLSRMEALHLLWVIRSPRAAVMSKRLTV